MAETEQPLEAREAAIAQELKTEMEKTPDAVHSKLGNFWMNVLPAEEGEISFRGAPELLGQLDQKPQNPAQFSDLRNSQTYREFFAVIDATRAEFDKHREVELEVKNLKLLKSEHLGDRDVLVRKLNEKLMPIYIRLRALGYKDTDFNK